MNKKDFPIFEKHKDLVYLDSAATSQRPKIVIDELTNFYENENANIHRGVYDLAEQATQKFEDSRKKVAEFINADKEDIVFTKNATESLNIIANGIKPLIPEGKDEIILTEMEHHANLVPWQEFAKKHNFKLLFIPVKDNFELDYDKLDNLIGEKTAIVSLTHISNVLGTENDVKKVVEIAKENNALTVIDACQSIAHKKIDIKEISCDFLVFSSHKMFGPTGIGVLFGKKELLKEMNPLLFGGGMIEKVDLQNSTYLKNNMKFETGTQNIGEALGLKKAIEYINEIKINNIENHDKELTNYCIKKLKELDFIELYTNENSLGIVSFNVKNIHCHDVASILSDEGICVRAGHHCCMPLMNKLGISGVCRASFSVYNDESDVDKLILALKKVREVFNDK